MDLQVLCFGILGVLFVWVLRLFLFVCFYLVLNNYFSHKAEGSISSQEIHPQFH